MQPYFDPTRKTTSKKKWKTTSKKIKKLKTTSKKNENEDDLRKNKNKKLYWLSVFYTPLCAKKSVTKLVLKLNKVGKKVRQSPSALLSTIEQIRLRMEMK